MTRLKLTERDVTRQIVDFMSAHGWRPIRMQVAHIATVAGGFEVGEPGMPDYLFLRYLGVMAGHRPPLADCLWVEMKAPGKRLAPSQIAWHRTERFRGGAVIVTDDLDEFIAWYSSEIGD